MVYRSGVLADLQLLVELRLAFLHIEKEHQDYKVLKENLYDYFEKSFHHGNQEIILVEAEGKVIGTGIIFYYTSVPSAANLSGKNGYITSIYVAEEYRGRKIATAILDRLLQDAKRRGVACVFLSTSEMGRSLYYKKGFSDSQDGMFLRL